MYNLIFIFLCSLHTINEGRLATGDMSTGFLPCTPNGVMELIKRYVLVCLILLITYSDVSMSAFLSLFSLFFSFFFMYSTGTVFMYSVIIIFFYKYLFIISPAMQ